MTKKKLIEGLDFTWVEIDGIKFKVFTEAYLLKRGVCCKNMCKNCPFKNNNKLK